MTISANILRGVVRAYQLVVRPALPPACRFEPNCSEYYRQALQGHSVIRATGLALRRIGRCHPWHEGGYDPPPQGRSEQRGDVGA